MSLPGDEHLTAIREAAGDQAGLVWLKMLYRCEGCHAQNWIAAEVGIEGPPDLRSRSLFVASPFAFRCGACGELVSHVEFRKDQEFAPRPRKQGEHLFRLPTSNWQQGAVLELDEGNFA